MSGTRFQPIHFCIRMGWEVEKLYQIYIHIMVFTSAILCYFSACMNLYVAQSASHHHIYYLQKGKFEYVLCVVYVCRIAVPTAATSNIVRKKFPFSLVCQRLNLNVTMYKCVYVYVRTVHASLCGGCAIFKISICSRPKCNIKKCFLLYFELHNVEDVSTVSFFVRFLRPL